MWEIETGVFTSHISLLLCTFLALFQHVCVDIRTDDARFTVSVNLFGVIEHTESNVAGAAGYVEDGHGLAAGLAAGVEGADKVVFPEAVNAEGHGVVHNVI